MHAFSGVISYVEHTALVQGTEHSVYILDGKFNCVIARGVLSTAAIV